MDKRKLLLALAQRMIDKQISDNKLESAQEIQLYLNILEYQEKYHECLEFLNTPLCQKLFPEAPVAMKLELMKKLKKWPEINILLKQLLTER
jgi:N-terminal acetyltransferase B complex non-catalytic subunit